MPAKEQKSLWQSYSKIQKSYYDINVHCNKLFKGNNDEVEKTACLLSNNIIGRERKTGYLIIL